MIAGIGTDLLKIDRLKAAYQRTNGRLAERILGPDEMQVFKGRLARNESRGMAYLATRFAAKEALAKALGTGLRAPVLLPAIHVEHDDLGKPFFSFEPALADWISQRSLQIHLSITDEVDHAVAFVEIGRAHV